MLKYLSFTARGFDDVGSNTTRTASKTRHHRPGRYSRAIEDGDKVQGISDYV